ncbi:hypothetical protein ACFL96_12670 [Thermoproteota archaeon]
MNRQMAEDKYWGIVEEVTKDDRTFVAKKMAAAYSAGTAITKKDSVEQIWYSITNPAPVFVLRMYDCAVKLKKREMRVKDITDFLESK